jgi:hypothetical protein
VLELRVIVRRRGGRWSLPASYSLTFIDSFEVNSVNRKRLNGGFELGMFRLLVEHKRVLHEVLIEPNPGAMRRGEV